MGRAARPIGGKILSFDNWTLSPFWLYALASRWRPSGPSYVRGPGKPSPRPSSVGCAPRDTTGPESSAFPLRPRFTAACLPSPAPGTPNGQIAGTSVAALFASARSQDASATRLTLTLGSGLADSIPAVTLASARATPPKCSTMPVASSKRHGQCFCRSEPRADFQEWHDQRDWTAEKYRRFGRGERMPPDWKPQRAAG